MDPRVPQISPDASHDPAGLPPDDARRRRILFRATHRGTYENDILVGSFVRKRLAGFTEADLSIEVRENALTLKGERKSETKSEFLHQGIAARTFERRFQLADHVQVTGAALENGLLHIDLVREVPEAKKPRRIQIATAGRASAPVIEGDVRTDAVQQAA